MKFHPPLREQWWQILNLLHFCFQVYLFPYPYPCSWHYLRTRTVLFPHQKHQQRPCPCLYHYSRWGLGRGLSFCSYYGYSLYFGILKMDPDHAYEQSGSQKGGAVVSCFLALAPVSRTRPALARWMCGGRLACSNLCQRCRKAVE